MEGQTIPLLHASVVSAILQHDVCKTFLRRCADNLRTKLRQTVENIGKILDPAEDEVLREIFVNSEGINVDLRMLQFERIQQNEDWQNDIYCVPQTILEKIMIKLGFLVLSKLDTCLITESTANMECAVIASLIWR